LAVITNLFPHHLDRYENFEGYVQAKLNLVRAGSATCPVVVGEMDPLARRLLLEAVGQETARLTPVAKPKQPIELLVPGEHNQVNAACVMTVCRLMGLDDESVRASLKTFRGLPHRLELVGKVGGVEYINDSKSTAPAATIIALDALRERQGKLIAIVGGQAKDVPLADCAMSLAQSCRTVVCYGEAGSAFAAAVEEANAETPARRNQYRDHEGAVLNAKTTISVVHKVEDAVALAAKLAQAGETVLFSPGAPSFDQYVNFTERGRHFAALVSALK
jgi:UDP-N-acetylmuramoylalanine--D-glutamate ligase